MKISSKSFEKTNKTIEKVLGKALENKYVLYFVFFLAIITLFGYLITGNLISIAVFVLIGYVTHYFNQNMIVVISVPLVLTSFFMMGKKVKEGLDTQKSMDSATPATTPTTTSTMPTATTTTMSSATNTPTASPSPATPTTSIAAPSIATPSTAAPSIATPSTSAEKTTDKKPSTTSVTPAPTPASTPITEKFMNGKKNRIDYASTIEDAYSDLNKLLESDGIKQLTSDTQVLMQQQLELAGAIKSMSPLLEQAKGLLQGFDMKNLGGIASLAKSFNTN
jgi:hypothetical protein